MHTPSTSHNQQNIINAPPPINNTINNTAPTAPHAHNTNTAPTTQHHQRSIGMAGAALGASQPHFACRCSTWTLEAPQPPLRAGAALGAALACLGGRRSAWNSFGSFCLASAALGALQAPLAWQVQHLEHHPHNSSYTISSDTPLSSQHHLHNIINTTSLQKVKLISN